MCAGVEEPGMTAQPLARAHANNTELTETPRSCAMRATALVEVGRRKAGAAERVVGRNDDALAGPGRDGGVPRRRATTGGTEFDSPRAARPCCPPDP